MEKQILVINSGSTSLKYKLFDWETLNILKENNFSEVKNYSQILKQALREVGNLANVVVIGHRIVHGGKEFVEPTIIDEKILARIEKYNELAPLHNEYNLKGIRACLEYIPYIPNIGVFDTAFFKDLPDKTKIYPLPYKFYEEYGIQRFGFHGISHQYVAEEAAKKLKKSFSELKIITCHLGGGASMSAIDRGRVIDTSMGFTPSEGLMMMTRAGDLDVGIILKLLKLDSDIPIETRIQEINDLLNFGAGIKGLTQCDNFLSLLKEVTFNNPRAKLALDIFIYRIQKYIGAYYAILNGCDTLVFTGAIGAGNPETREKICQDLRILKETKILAIPTNEELQIAREIKKFLE